MSSRENLHKTLNHEEPKKLVLDFGASPVTGIHVLAIKKLRSALGLENKLIRIIEPYQMLGEIDEELASILETDILGIWGEKNMFGVVNSDCDFKSFHTPWGQEVLVPENFNTISDKEGDIYMFPEGDISLSPSAKMPKTSYFFDAIIRQDPIDDAKLQPEDNLEEFEIWDKDTENYWTRIIDSVPDDMGLLVNPGGTAIGDIALVPGIQLRNPKGIRDISEWYMSTMQRTDYLHKVFSKQTDIALVNLEKLFAIAGNRIDVIFLCGTDFGTQTSTFISEEQYRELYMPYYLKLTKWIHSKTSWKVFKHSCGAIESFIPAFIESGFDILNPVQINAAGMEPFMLKKKYGKDIVFWGGGIDTQEVLSFAMPSKVKDAVLRSCEIFSRGGGYVFNTVHNTLANVPEENLCAMIEALREFRGE